MKTIIASLILLFFSAVLTNAYGDTQKTIELKLYPAVAADPNKYPLLPKYEEQNDLDAAPLYKKAIQALPVDSKNNQISQWLKSPLNELPLEQAKSFVEGFKPALQLVQQAAKCRKCIWPAEQDAKDLQNYRRIAQTLALQARLEIAQGQYDNAVSKIRTDFAMGRHLSKSSSTIQGLVGIAAAAHMCEQIEQFIEAPDAPNLYRSLQSLPRPLIDLTKQIESEPNELAREKIRQLMNRLDRHIAVLQCVEALRYYAAVNDGKLPGSLEDIKKSIKQVSIPNDPVTQKSFDYSCSGSEAILKGPAPVGAESDKAIYYRLVLSQRPSKNNQQGQTR